MNALPAALGFFGQTAGDIAVGLQWLFVLATALPTVAVTIRRLHDTGRSGLYALLYLILIAGEILLFFDLVEEGEPGRNRFGENPKAAAEPPYEYALLASIDAPTEATR